MSSNFVIYLIGYAIVASGIAYAMYAIGLGQAWIIAAVLMMVGLGVVTALTRSKRGDVADATVEQKESSARSI